MKKIKSIFPILIYSVAGLILLVYASILCNTQSKLNEALTDSVNIYLNTGEDGSSESKIQEYHAAITYLEAARQLYNENNTINIASLVYVLMSTVILAHGTKLLQVSERDKKELFDSIVEKTKSNFINLLNGQKNKLQDHQSRLMDVQLKQTNGIFLCVSAIQLSYLLQTRLSGYSSEQDTQKDKEALERIHIDFVRSLTLLSQHLSNNSDVFNVEYYYHLSNYIYQLKKASSTYLECKKPHWINDDKIIAKEMGLCEIALEKLQRNYIVKLKEIDKVLPE